MTNKPISIKQKIAQLLQIISANGANMTDSVVPKSWKRELLLFTNTISKMIAIKYNVIRKQNHIVICCFLIFSTTLLPC